MKKRLLLFAILFFGLCGCDKDNGEDVDPPGIGHFVWVNASDHRITMTVNGQFEDEIMLPGERISKTMIGFCSSVWRLRHLYCSFWRPRRLLSCISHPKKKWKKHLQR